MDAKARIRELMAERKWSEYRLAIASGLSQSTVANIFNRNTTPSIATLESICAGFGITLAQFFAEGDMVELTENINQYFGSPSGKKLLEELRQLLGRQRKAEQYVTGHREYRKRMDDGR